MENKKFLLNGKFVALLSFTFSFILWLIIAIAVNPIAESVINDVGVNINTQSGIVSQMGLSAIDGGESTVNVVISGSRAVIGGVTPADIKISASLSGVSGAGTYNLNLSAVNNTSKNFDIVALNPSTIQVKFDKLVKKTIPVKFEIDGKYDIPDECIQGMIYSDPSEIEISGPETDINAIESAFVSVSLSGTCTSTEVIPGAIRLADENNNIVSFNQNEISLSSNTANIIITIHEVKDLPLYFEYINVPQFFNVEYLNYNMSQASVSVDADVGILDNYNDLFIGYIDLSTIDLDNNVFNLKINLPPEVDSLDNNGIVKVEYNLEGFVEETFYVNHVVLLNSLSGYKASTNILKLPVKIIGPQDVIDELSSDDIVVQIDLSKREINQTGQYKMPADIVLPGGQFAWAVGSYTVPITVKKP